MNIWEMTLDEYRQSLKGQRIAHYYYSRKGQIITNHRVSVEQALQLGKPVRKEIISSNDYLVKYKEDPKSSG